MEHSDDQEGDLSAEEKPNDYNQHQGGLLEVSLASVRSNKALAKKVSKLYLAHLQVPLDSFHLRFHSGMLTFLPRVVIVGS